MPTDPAVPHHRRSIRLPGYDYAQEGAYFITLCTHNREHLFGEIVNGEMVLNDLGKIVHDEWNHTSIIRPTIELGEFVVMPNHFHGIILIVDGRGTAHRAPTGDIPTYEQFGKPVAGSIPTVVRGFKSAATKRINIFRNTPGAPVWQRNYYEHIIRNEKSYFEIAQYIFDNPAHWETDSEFS
ncbi:MAG: transposase [Bellilinea sp.]